MSIGAHGTLTPKAKLVRVRSFKATDMDCAAAQASLACPSATHHMSHSDAAAAAAAAFQAAQAALTK
jgi:hypothetical protein